jgi:hypothetical protein
MVRRPLSRHCCRTQAAATLIALFADIHANRQAFEACLARARDQSARRFVLLPLYSVSPAATTTAFTPTTNTAIPLLPGRRWLADRLFVGSDGQPQTYHAIGGGFR